MTTTTVDVQIVPLCNCTDCIRNVVTTLCGIDGVKLLYVDYTNAKFTIETTLHREEIRDALQYRFPGTSVLVSGRINTLNSSIQGPLSFHDTARELVDGSRGKGLENVEYTQSTTLRMNFNDQPTTSRSATNVRDSEHGGYGYVPPTPAPPSQPPPPPLQKYQASTSGSARAYERYGPPPPSAPPMPTGEGYYYSGEEYAYGYPSKKKYMEDEYYSGGSSTILLCLFYGILILFLIISIKSE